MKKSLGAQALVMPAPVWIVCSYDPHGKANAMAVAWGGVCCSEPPCLTVSLRKATYSYGCLMSRKAYTVNVLSEEQIKAADYFGIVSGRDHDKFTDTGLTAVKSDLVDAPYIAEAPLVVECRLRHTFEIGLHTQFVGEIIDVKVDETVLGEKGAPDILKIKPAIYVPKRRAYFGVGKYLGEAYVIGKTYGK